MLLCCYNKHDLSCSGKDIYYGAIPPCTGLLFSGKITEPLNIEDGMVNIKFNSNCIAVICPIKENAIKTWRLNHITSFGQCGGILTFECCSTCSDPGTSRCSINIIQEKSTTVLNLMEKAIRSNPNTSEIHYERSILGDIYHCDHDCGQPQRLLPAYSDPNIYRSTSTSPQKQLVSPIDIHEFEVRNSTVSSGKSSDSGFPDTPLPHHDVPSLNRYNPSPADSGIRKHSNTRVPPTPPVSVHARSFSETARLPDEDPVFDHRPRTDTDPFLSDRLERLNYSDVMAHLSPRRCKVDDDVQYATVQLASPSRDPRSNQKLEPVDENEDIYDKVPFEHCWIDGAVSPIGASSSSQRSSRSDSSTGLPITVKVTPIQTTSSYYTPGSDMKDRSEDLQEVPVVPSRQRRNGRHHQVKEMVNLFNGANQSRGRSRLHSTGDVLDCNVKDCKRSPRSKMRVSMENLTQTGVNGVMSRNDFLSELHKEDELLTKFLARSRNEKNDELCDLREDELAKPYRCFTHEELDCTSPRSGRSSTASNRSGVDRVLTKVANDTVRGYAYKIQIPLSDTVYDVPRRAAPAPDLSNLRSDAPPKPQRYITSTDP